MVELICTSFADHITRMHREFTTQRAVFDLPADKWFRPDPGGPDLSVQFHDQRAGNAAGPAAGPHGQMAQNIVLSYLAGGRIMELKTVQTDDQLRIPRPCIDATNVGYNVEWSQELRLHESLHEYVSGAMLVHIIRNTPLFANGGIGTAQNAGFDAPSGDVIYDMSVGYDLAGIQSPRVRRFIEGMLDAAAIVDAMRLQIPSAYAALRNLDYPTRLSTSITLSTFHGCPADEIEKICEHLITEYGVNVIVKMNPPMLGKERLEHLLHDVLGYDQIRVHQPAYTNGLQFDESIEMIRRLDALAKKRGRRVGAKFSNTLEVENHRDFFTPDNQVMYMSGAPLFVITSALTARFREAIGPDCPITFSAGVDQKNFLDVAACDIKPVTTCTDLLRPGGYARLPKYLSNLSADMARLNAATMREYVVARCEDADALADAKQKYPGVDDVTLAGWINTRKVADHAAGDPRYHAKNNSKVPKRIASHLVVFDCITCDKCIPVCPNDANFTYPLAQQKFNYSDYRISPNGDVTPDGETKLFETEQSMQIANFADYCNECGNCDTFCPEYGGPFIEKPTFFSRLDEFQRHRNHDGFCVVRRSQVDVIHGRIEGAEYALRINRTTGESQFIDSNVQIDFDNKCQPVSAARLDHRNNDHTINMQIVHTLRLLAEGVLDPNRINPVNACTKVSG